MTETIEHESDFGKGLVYCLGLFLCHSEREYGLREQDKRLFKVDTWFNGASDHFYDMEIPNSLPESLRSRLTELRDKCLSWGHGFGLDGLPPATEANRKWAIDEAKELLRLLDEHFGIATLKASWA